MPMNYSDSPPGEERITIKSPAPLSHLLQPKITCQTPPSLPNETYVSNTGTFVLDIAPSCIVPLLLNARVLFRAADLVNSFHRETGAGQ